MIDKLPWRIRHKLRATGDCWLWTGGVSGGGYGYYTYQGKTWRVHRLVYTLLVGPIPDGLQLDHVKARGCESRLCVNPAHLEPVTHRENVRRGSAGKINNVQSRKTHCPRGHRYDGKRGGRRYCLRCHGEAQARYLEKSAEPS